MERKGLSKTLTEVEEKQLLVSEKQYLVQWESQHSPQILASNLFDEKHFYIAVLAWCAKDQCTNILQ